MGCSFLAACLAARCGLAGPIRQRSCLRADAHAHTHCKRTATRRAGGPESSVGACATTWDGGGPAPERRRRPGGRPLPRPSFPRPHSHRLPARGHLAPCTFATCQLVGGGLAREAAPSVPNSRARSHMWAAACNLPHAPLMRGPARCALLCPCYRLPLLGVRLCVCAVLYRSTMRAGWGAKHSLCTRVFRSLAIQAMHSSHAMTHAAILVY